VNSDADRWLAVRSQTLRDGHSLRGDVKSI